MQSKFDVCTATFEEWQAFLLDEENHEKVFLGEYEKPSRSLLERSIDAFVHSDVPLEARIAATTRAVDVVVSLWEYVSQIGCGRMGLYTNPLSVVHRMAYVDGIVSHALLEVVLRLWDASPKRSDYTAPETVLLMSGLGVHVPLDNDTIEAVYRQHFAQYSFVALRTLFKRGEVARAGALFEEFASQYPDFDPLTLDSLVHAGLPVVSATKWLDQSVNAKPTYEGHYEGAVTRWNSIAAHIAQKQ